jgi:hypothetical protein
MSMTEAVYKFGIDGTKISSPLISGLNNPQGIAVSGTDIFVRTGTGVGQYTTLGITVNASLITGLYDRGTYMTVPIAVADSNLFVANNDKIAVYNLDGSLINASLISGLSTVCDFEIAGSPVPESSTYALILGLTSLGYGIVRRRRSASGSKSGK